MDLNAEWIPVEYLDGKGSGIKTARMPYRAPNCNAYAERFVLSIKTGCMNRMMFFGEDSRRAINGYIEHHNTESPHQGIGNVKTANSEPNTGERSEALGWAPDALGDTALSWSTRAGDLAIIWAGRKWARLEWRAVRPPAPSRAAS